MLLRREADPAIVLPMNNEFPDVILAQRLGISRHISPLRFKLKRLAGKNDSPKAVCLEDWLVNIANARGACVVMPFAAACDFIPPTEEDLLNEELVAAICQPENLDRPQMLRLAAQLITGHAVNVKKLCLIARRERVERVLAELARQALRVEPAHTEWNAILTMFGSELPFREPLLHWTRLAEPVMGPRGYNAVGWRLVA